MRVGLFFGSFNPIHHGHLIIANHIRNEDLVDQVWFVVSPHNPFKKKEELSNEYTRLHLLQKAIEGINYFKVLDVEFKMNRPSYTIFTLGKLGLMYPQIHFSIIMGSDSFENIGRWHQGDTIKEKYRLIVYERNGFEKRDRYDKNVTMISNPIIEISSTRIRDLVRAGKSIKYLLPDVVVEEIEKAGLYKK
jgi:nicotinate-nucleotide adenylyltransferase